MPTDKDPLEGIDPATIIWGTAHLTATASSDPPARDPEEGPGAQPDPE